MADNVAITAGSGTSIAADDISSVFYQRVKIGLGADGTAVDAVGGTGVDGTGVMRVSLATNVALPAGTNGIGKLTANSGVDIGDVDVTSVPTDPFGANADAASATGSISAKLKAIATALGVTALDLGSGTGGSRTLRILLDTTQVQAAGDQYETVAASQTAQVLGGSGATGDFISGILVIPATTSPGNVLLLDNATSITVFAGGASSVSNLVPFLIPLGIKSVSGAWKITTGSNVSCIGMGTFTA